ncbi:MAG: AarF/ABC1/UbiB kinase family protein [Methanosphaera sp.]|nr:AarF/ABC1/UbiB kinase family protein [Methanosphaera sp.]
MTSNNDSQINSRDRFNEIVIVAKKHNLGKLLRASSKRKDDGSYDEDIDISGLRLAMEELGPAFVKLGQILCTRPDLVGVEMAEDLKKLRDDTKTTPFDEMKAVIEETLGRPLEEMYSQFNEDPIGSASIGQVYTATLKDSNEKVAVKVQKPGVYEIVAADVKIMKDIAAKTDKYITKARTYNLPAIVKEFERSIFKELDYMEEVMNMQKITHNFEHEDYIKIPKVYTDYCGDKVITMELIDGIQVTELFDHEIEGIDNKTIANYGVRSYFKQVILDGFFHADPHPGNMFITKDGKVCYIDFGMMGILTEEFRSDLARLIIILLEKNSNNLIKQLVHMKIITPEQDTEELRMDIEDLLARYMGAELDQMDGIFEKLLNTMIKHNVTLPREFVMIGRGIALIEDTGSKLDPEFNAAEEVQKLSYQIIAQRLNPVNIATGGINYVMEIENLLKDLPDRINSTLNKVEKGEIQMNVNHTGLDSFKNQISVSLILSALIIGSSLAILADKGPKLFDISAIGFLGFVISVILGLYVVMGILSKD